MNLLQTVAPKFGKAAAWTFLTVFLIFSLFPIFWALRTAFTTNASLLEDPFSILPPDPTTINFERVVGDAPIEEIQASGVDTDKKIDMLSAVKNSVIVATGVAIGQVCFCSMAAYAFARLKFRGREALFVLFLTALMVPPIFSLIPNFILLRDLEIPLGFFTLDLSWLPGAGKQGYINTHIGLIAPTFFMTPFAVFFLRQFFLSINKSVEEAAVLDGAGHIRRFFEIIIPMSAAPLATIAIIAYVNGYNDFLWPFVAGRDESVRVVTVALNDFKAQTPGSTRPDWTGLMTATFVAGLPVMVLFSILGRRVVDSIQFSGIK